MGLFADRDQEIEASATGHDREIPNQDEDLGDDGRVNLGGLVVVPVLPLSQHLQLPHEGEKEVVDRSKPRHN